MILLKDKLPTNEQIRQQAISMVQIDNTVGNRADCLRDILGKYLELQFQYFPSFCEDTRIVNAKHNKELKDYGIKGKYTESYGWSKDRTLKSQWVISDQLKYFMDKIDPVFWEDSNARVRNSFMKGVLRGDDSYNLLNKVYSYYGQNNTQPVEEVSAEEFNLSK